MSNHIGNVYYFRCLDSSGGMLLNTPYRSGQIIKACAVLHNIAVRNALPIPQDNDWDGNVRPQRRDVRVAPEVCAGQAVHGGEHEDQSGAMIRRRLIRYHFQR